MGNILYWGVNYCLPIQFCLCVIFLFVFRHKKIYTLFKHTYLILKLLLQSAPKKLKSKSEHAATYLSKDVLGERKFIATLFVRLLAVVYFIAFASLLWQFQVVSENGLIPYKEFVRETWKHEGLRALLNYPSVFWLCQSNPFILIVLSFALAVSVFSIFFHAKAFNYFMLWFLYLSVVNFGRDLFNFPWDLFLLEIGFISVITLYFINRVGQLPRILLFALLLLFFRQWFSMGMIKILWSDSAWHDLTYMKYFWLNQPSPTPCAWYMYQLPMVFHRFFTASTLVLEMSIPTFMLLGRKGRIVAFFISLLLSVMIEVNGNFGFFNMLTAIFGLWCLDDTFFKRKTETIPFGSLRKTPVVKMLYLILILPFIGLNLLYVYLQLTKQSNHPVNIVNYYFFDESITNKSGIVRPMIFELGKIYSRFRIASPHGVFKNIPRHRTQMQLQVKIQGYDWQDIKFKKGYDITDFHFVAPVMCYLPFKFHYWSAGTDFFQYLKLHPNSKYINSWIMNLIHGIFVGNSEIHELISYSNKGKVEQIRVYRTYMYINKNSNNPFEYNVPQNKVIDSFYINPTDTNHLTALFLLKLKATE